jgi:hypothetical protein
MFRDLDLELEIQLLPTHKPCITPQFLDIPYETQLCHVIRLIIQPTRWNHYQRTALNPTAGTSGQHLLGPLTKSKKKNQPGVIPTAPGKRGHLDESRPDPPPPNLLRSRDGAERVGDT